MLIGSNGVNNFHLPALLYDWAIEKFLRRSKVRIAQSIQDSQLFPVLDVCCGTGRQCSIINRGKKLVVGLDFDNKMLQYGHSKYRSTSFICANATNIPFRDSCFKGIIISYALHEQSRSFRYRLVEETDRLLASNGRLFIIDFDQIWEKRSIIAFCLIYLIEKIAGKEQFLNGRNFLRQGALSSFIRRANFKVIEKTRRALGNSSLIVLKKTSSP